MTQFPSRRRMAITTAVIVAAVVMTPLASSLPVFAATNGVETDPNDGVPRTDSPTTYSSFPAVVDPGRGAENYFEPKWFDTDGRHIQAHGGQIVTTIESGETVYYWYGEDRSLGYWNSPGVAVYRSTDAKNWTNLGDALRSVSSRDDLLTPYFEELYDTIDENGQPRDEKIDALTYHLNSQRSSDETAIFERPKVIYNARDNQWVMWWHADGRIEPGGSTYARSMAAVAVSDSPTGPFRMTGAFRMPNREQYQECTSSAVPGQARDMTVFQDDDGQAYISYSSEENHSLYVAKLDDSYTNVTHTVDRDTINVNQYSESGRYPYIFADGSADAPVRGVDFQIVKECGLLESPAIFERDGTYSVLASGTTGWAPNPQTYYTTRDLMGSWIRGVEADDANETVPYNRIPDGGDGLLSIGDVRRTTFGSQATNVFEIEPGKFVYMGDRWNEGEADSTYVWLPLTTGENGRLEMHNPAVKDPARYANGWDVSYWDDKGFGSGIWQVSDDRIPTSVRRGSDAAAALPASVRVDVNGTVSDTAVTWSGLDTRIIGQQTITGILAEGNGFTKGRSFERTVRVSAPGLIDISGEADVHSSTPGNNVERIIDGDSAAKGWDDWSAQGNPRSSWLEFDWTTSQQLDSVVVHMFKDGNTATWPSLITAQYRDHSGAWADTQLSATVAQDNAGPAPVATIDLSSLPKTDALRLNLTTETDTWQSISEVGVWARGVAANICRTQGSSVSASFSQTDWETFPAANACDGRDDTVWSTWSASALKDSVQYTIETSEPNDINGLQFTNTEGSITSLAVDYRNAVGVWEPVSTLTSGDVVNGEPTRVGFDRVSATGVRITFGTPGSFLKIPEIVVPALAPIEPTVTTVTPKLSTTEPANAAGWYRAPVIVAFEHDGSDRTVVEHRIGSDSEWSSSGSVVVSADGASSIEYRARLDGQIVTGVGGTIQVKLDTQAPTTTADVNHGANVSGESVARVENLVIISGAALVSFSAVDTTSGTAYTEYSVDSSSTWTRGGTVAVGGVGAHEVRFRSADIAGNVEATQTVAFTVNPNGNVGPGTPGSPSTPGAPGASGPNGSAGIATPGWHPATAPDRAGGLAETGIDLSWAIVGAASFFVLTGTLLVVSRRRRQA